MTASLTIRHISNRRFAAVAYSDCVDYNPATHFPDWPKLSPDQRVLGSIFADDHAGCMPPLLAILRSDNTLDLMCEPCGDLRTYPPCIESEKGGV